MGESNLSRLNEMAMDEPNSAPAKLITQQNPVTEEPRSSDEIQPNLEDEMLVDSLPDYEV